MSATFGMRTDADGIVYTAIACEHGRKDGPNGNIPVDARAPLALSMLRGLNQNFGCSCKVRWIEEQWDDKDDAKAYFEAAHVSPRALTELDFDTATCTECTVGFFLKAAPRPGMDPDGEMYFYHEPGCSVGAATGRQQAWRPDIMDGSTRVV